MLPLKVDPKVLGKNLRKAREDKGLTQEEVAEALGINRATVIHNELGRYISKKLEKYADFYGTTVEMLMLDQKELMLTPPTFPTGEVGRVVETERDWGLPAPIIWVLNTSGKALRVERIARDDLEGMRRGDFVFIDISRTSVSDDGLYMVKLKGQTEPNLQAISVQKHGKIEASGRAVAYFRLI